MIDTDTEFELATIDRVDAGKDGWSIHRADGWSFWVGAEHGVEPHVGDEAKFYGRGIGSPVRGLMLNGRVVFYRTAEEEDAHRQRQVEADKRKRRDDFEREGRAKLDADYATLPAEFKRRLDGLRRRNPDFRWEYEGYEMMVCRDAALIALALKTADAVREFRAAPYEEQRRRVPDLSDGHSGNSFGAAVRLAWLYLTRPELVEREHGAMCPLTGCRDYGCAALDAEPADAD